MKKSIILAALTAALSANQLSANTGPGPRINIAYIDSARARRAALEAVIPAVIPAVAPVPNGGRVVAQLNEGRLVLGVRNGRLLVICRPGGQI